MTLLEILNKTTDYFKGKAIASARLDAELLLCHLLKCKRLNLYLEFDKPLQEAEVQAFREMVRRRASREPLQHIIGVAPFMDLEVVVNRSVLVPRPETASIVEALLQDVPEKRSGTVLDLATGSGIIALSIKKARPDFKLMGSDVSPEALAVAKLNGQRLSLDVEWVLSDCFRAMAGQRFDCIVSNPPYIPDDDLKSLMPEVRDFDPHIALRGGTDGLDFYRRILTEAPSYLASGGRLYFEHGDGQGAAIAELATAKGFVAIQTIIDLEGQARGLIFKIAG